MMLLHLMACLAQDLEAETAPTVIDSERLNLVMETLQVRHLQG